MAAMIALWLLGVSIYTVAPAGPVRIIAISLVGILVAYALYRLGAPARFRQK